MFGLFSAYINKYNKIFYIKKMIKYIRLLVEGFFDDEIFDVGNDIKQDIEDLGKYYDYRVGDIYYLNKKPYAICCGEPKYFKDNKPRFCLLNDSDNLLKWGVKLVKKLGRFNFKYFAITSFNDFQHIDENGYENTQIIKNNYDINEFPAFKYCINQGNNVYLPAIDELQIMYLNKDKLGKYNFSGYGYWSSTQYSTDYACLIFTDNGHVNTLGKFCNIRVRPFFYLN